MPLQVRFQQTFGRLFLSAVVTSKSSFCVVLLQLVNCCFVVKKTSKTFVNFAAHLTGEMLIVPLDVILKKLFALFDLSTLLTRPLFFLSVFFFMQVTFVHVSFMLPQVDLACEVFLANCTRQQGLQIFMCYPNVIFQGVLMFEYLSTIRTTKL